VKIEFFDDGRPRARYRSGTMVREEALDHTRLVGLYWSAGGQIQRENVTSGLPGLNPLEFPLHAFYLHIDGQDLRNRWEWVGASQRPGMRAGTLEGVVQLRHGVRPVSVKVITRLDGTSFMVRYLEITNTGTAPAALSRVSPWSGLLWCVSPHSWGTDGHATQLPAGRQTAFSAGLFEGRSQGNEGNFVRRPLPPGTTRFENHMGRSGFGGPYFDVSNDVTGERAVGALAWSGDWFAEFWVDPLRGLGNEPRRGFNMAFSMGPAGPAPLRVIAPGETVASPEVHLSMLHADTDTVVARTHEHIRSSVLPSPAEGEQMYSLSGRVVEHPGDWIMKEIDRAAEMGVEAFMVDAGWYGREFSQWWDNRGDWTVGDWIPGGLAACRARCASHGMKFGLWMEPEAVGPKSVLKQEHPEWILRTDDGRDVAGSMLDLSDPEAQRFFRESVLGVVRDHDLDFFKIDYNVLSYEGGQSVRDGFAEHESWRHMETLYSTFDEVRRKFPGLALENCASGGGRHDLGMMSRFHYAAVSDFSEFPRSIRAINAMTRFLPPEALCYYHNHTPVAHLKADLETHLRVTLFARPLYVGFGSQDVDCDSAFYRETRRYIALWKEWAKPMLGGACRVLHHTPDIGLYAPSEWCVLEYSSPAGDRGYAGVFRLQQMRPGGCREYVFKPRGLDPSRRYALTLDNARSTIEMSGAELALRGIPVGLEEANTSELLLFEAL
jgi:alpha-galactosidase